jgi:hypothetical protein
MRTSGTTPAGYQATSTQSNCTPSASRTSRLRADNPAGIPVSWNNSSAQQKPTAMSPARGGGIAGHSTKTPAKIIEA